MHQMSLYYAFRDVDSISIVSAHTRMYVLGHWTPSILCSALDTCNLRLSMACPEQKEWACTMLKRAHALETSTA